MTTTNLEREAMNPDLRNSDLATLATYLQSKNVEKLDLVVPSSALFMNDDGNLVVSDADPIGVSETGEIISSSIIVKPGDVCSEGISERLSIPIKYYKRMRDEKPALLARNVNDWLSDTPDRPHLLRCYRTEDGIFGRALLSDRFERIDDFDVLVGILDAVKEVAPDAEIVGCDLTERKMRVRIVAPSVNANIARHVQSYAPRGLGTHGSNLPLLFAGLVVENSETGCGAYSIVPRAVVQVCKNGLTRSMDALRRIHLGAKLDVVGAIDWSDETRKAQLDLVSSQSRDAVKLFLSDEMLSRFVETMDEAAGIEISAPVKTVSALAKTYAFTEEQSESILSHFLGSGDGSALGLAQAMTHAAKDFDSDLAALVEDEAISAVLAHRK